MSPSPLGHSSQSLPDGHIRWSNDEQVSGEPGMSSFPLRPGLIWLLLSLKIWRYQCLRSAATQSSSNRRIFEALDRNCGAFSWSVYKCWKSVALLLLVGDCCYVCGIFWVYQRLWSVFSQRKSLLPRDAADNDTRAIKLMRNESKAPNWLFRQEFWRECREHFHH